jgi:hypothetical protein
MTKASSKPEAVRMHLGQLTCSRILGNDIFLFTAQGVAKSSIPFH